MNGTERWRSSGNGVTAVVDGKFLRVGGERFLVRGVAYGSFAPRTDGHQFPEADQVARDFARMACARINTVRTYTVPPPDVLDAASACGLRVMAGLAWPQHVAFLEDRHRRREIIRDIGVQARSIASHPALLLTAIGNEIPPAVVRWHGPRRVERFIGAAVDEVRGAAPDMLLTYVNYPPTEFLELPFLDLDAFNVYLHGEAAMRAYVARLQHIAGTRPLLLAECGADSQRQGEDGQAALVAMQARVAFTEGACGAIVFGWTDEWWRGGSSVDDWSFGLVDRERRDKAACAAIAQVYDAAPFPAAERAAWPAVSVVVCAYNAASTVDDCLTALASVDYPHAEVIFVDDGSTDDTAARVGAYPWVRFIQTANGGLSAARNIGLDAARGDIVVYVDSDVRVDPSWLTYLVQPFVSSDAVAAGGPNVVPRDDGWFAQCVARAPGAPNHVLLDDRIAEHVPGCNFAVRREALVAIGGFDPIFVRAGDDVDVCWRLQERGGRIAFSPAALVWHHHRGRLSAYWRQQVGYGEGEAWLRQRHRHRFSRSGVAWRGRIYSGLPFVRSLTERQLHSGIWGTASFPTVYHTHAHPLLALPHGPEWQIASALLVIVGLAGLPWTVVITMPLVAVAAGTIGLGITVLKCALYASRSNIEDLPPLDGTGPLVSRAVYRTTIGWLHMVQPFARAYGYARGRLRPPVAPERAVSPGVDAPAAGPRAASHLALLLGRPHQCRFWSEAWASADILLTRIVDSLHVIGFGHRVQVDDGWRPDRDISIRVGPWGWADVQALVEDHGTGRCLFRARVQVRARPALLALTAAAATIAYSLVFGRYLAAALITVCALLVLARAARDVGRDIQQILHVVATVAGDYRMQGMPDDPSSTGTMSSSWRHLPATHGG
jgi:GT2 family glycosyltransferase